MNTINTINTLNMLNTEAPETPTIETILVEDLVVVAEADGSQLLTLTPITHYRGSYLSNNVYELDAEERSAVAEIGQVRIPAEVKMITYGEGSGKDHGETRVLDLEPGDLVPVLMSDSRISLARITRVTESQIKATLESSQATQLKGAAELVFHRKTWKKGSGFGTCSASIVTGSSQSEILHMMANDAVRLALTKIEDQRKAVKKAEEKAERERYLASAEGMAETARNDRWEGLMISVRDSSTRYTRRAEVMLTWYDPKAGKIRSYAKLDVQQECGWYGELGATFAAPTINWSSYGHEDYRRAHGMIRMLARAQEIATSWEPFTGTKPMTREEWDKLHSAPQPEAEQQGAQS